MFHIFKFVIRRCHSSKNYYDKMRQVTLHSRVYISKRSNLHSRVYISKRNNLHSRVYISKRNRSEIIRIMRLFKHNYCSLLKPAHLIAEGDSVVDLERDVSRNAHILIQRPFFNHRRVAPPQLDI